MRTALATLTTALALTLTGCGGDDTSSGQPAGAMQTTPTPAAPACSELIGRPTSPQAMNSGCTRDDGGLHFYGAASYDCVDGRHLYWNDLGWGWSDGPFQPHSRPDGQLVPPEGDMTVCLG